MAVARSAGLRAAAALAVLALAGCGELATPADGGGFAGRTYVAGAFTSDGVEQQVVPGSALQLSFASDAVAASAGCNTMSATGGISDGTLVVTDLASTEMACEPALMAQEQWWAAFLTGRPRVEVGERSLVLTAGSTAVSMTSVESVADLPLARTDWQLTTIIDGEAASSVPAATVSTLRVDDGALTVTVGDCRSTTVAVAESGGRLRFDPQPFAQPVCTGEAAALEAAVLRVYSGGQVEVLVDGDRLRVGGAGGTSLDYLG